MNGFLRRNTIACAAQKTAYIKKGRANARPLFDICRPIEHLDEARENWGNGEECSAAIRQFIQCLPREVRYQVRAVFFAELGEKWDSMETVYEFMRDDPRFDPVVVLTPVLRQIQDRKGTVEQEIIYKDYLTPMGIPFLDCDEYSLGKDCPVNRYAWKVVCGTEGHYNYYCKYSVLGGTNALLTGIPKLDKLANLKRDGIARPAEELPDGIYWH